MLKKKIAVIGAGWAGLAAAVEAVSDGHDVHVYEMSSQPGGRARWSQQLENGFDLDNGQHILIGAYTQCLRLMQQIGVDLQEVLLRIPLNLRYANGRGLRLPRGPASLSFVWGVLFAKGWTLHDRWSLIRTSIQWFLSDFQCDPALTVAEFTQDLPRRIRRDLINPLCVAALNTPSTQASAQVFLRVLNDALRGPHGSSDLLIPQKHLGALFPQPAIHWLTAAERQTPATVHNRTRVLALRPESLPQQVHPSFVITTAEKDEHFDAVIVAASAQEASRLLHNIDAAWAQSAQALVYEPITTVWLHAPDKKLPAPMIAVPSDDTTRPAQYLFDMSQCRDLRTEPAAEGLFAAVISGSSQWLDRDAPVENLVRQQLQSVLGWATVVQTITEKRATFLCTPHLQRPAQRIVPGLCVAGDYVDGPYPATLEGAVRSGIAAYQAIHSHP